MGADDRAHHASAESFKRSVDQGCYICSSLWRLWTRDGQLKMASADDPAGGFTVCSITPASPGPIVRFEFASTWNSSAKQVEQDYDLEYCTSPMSSFTRYRILGKKWELRLSWGRNVKPDSSEVGCFLVQDASDPGDGHSGGSREVLRLIHGLPTPDIRLV